jgi:hypothetical protein
LAILNNATIIVHVQVFVWMLFFSFLLGSNEWLM